LAEGLMPHAVCERWYYARVPFHPNHAEDITSTIERKIEALCAHDEMLRNTLHQMQLQLKTWGRHVPMIDAGITGDFKPLIADLLRSEAAETGKAFGFPQGRMAEVFRVNRFGAYEGLMQSQSEALPGESKEMHTRPCFDPETVEPLVN
jgi:hypothetical protein